MRAGAAPVLASFTAAVDDRTAVSIDTLADALSSAGQEEDSRAAPTRALDLARRAAARGELDEKDRSAQAGKALEEKGL